MTEAEWFGCTDCVAMLDGIAGEISERKTRLFACACCRRFQEKVEERQFIEALETAERFADGRSSKAALKRARQGVRAVRHGLATDRAELHAKWTALWLAEVTNSENAFAGVAHEIQRLASQGLIAVNEQSAGADLLRCILGNPFHPVIVKRRWLASDVVALARTIYDESAFERLPDLADALEQAGCDNDDLLGHCRSRGAHAKGCWVVDLLLGKQ